MKEQTIDIEEKLRTIWKSGFDIQDGIVEAVRILNSSLILNSKSDLFGIFKIIPVLYFS